MPIERPARLLYFNMLGKALTDKNQPAANKFFLSLRMGLSSVELLAALARVADFRPITDSML